MDEKRSALVAEKPVPLSYDFGSLAVFDLNRVEALDENGLKSAARDNIQQLVNQILHLPTQKTVDSNSSAGQQDSTTVLFQLPEPTTQLPRAKPLPKAKDKTKWELFAEKRGIQKKKKDGKMVYDEESGQWMAKWGYKGKNKKIDNQWLVEVDDKYTGTDKELINPRTLARQERKFLVKKNQRQQERNLKGRE